MSTIQNLIFSKEYIWTLQCICTYYHIFVFPVYAFFLTIQNTFYTNVLSTLKGNNCCKAYIHAYVCEILNADTHTNTYTHPHIYSLSEKYFLLLSIMLRGFVFLCCVLFFFLKMVTVTKHSFFSSFLFHTSMLPQSQEFTAHLEESFSTVFNFIIQSNNLKYTAL